MLPTDLDKNREIVFHALPEGQAGKARQLLHGLDGIQAEIGDRSNILVIRYSIVSYTLEGLETALSEQGFHLDNSLLSKFKRALAYFVENVQRENLAANKPDAKSQQIFMKVYEQHLHGDRDETPEEWRTYK
jgi:hypothetical protein